MYLALGGVDLEGVGFRSFANTRVACHVPPCVRHASLVATLCTRRYQRYSGPGRTSSWRLLPRDVLAYAYDSGSPWVSAESVSKRGVIPVFFFAFLDSTVSPTHRCCRVHQLASNLVHQDQYDRSLGGARAAVIPISPERPELDGV